ncbi:MAG: molybdopterin-synthase adenylyltransferase MoeB [Gammaproteobacteria bacterium]|nr:molybdopterin-synthase adenylyltransferase MoeB [Gammaproteobacteria bacterium]
MNDEQLLRYSRQIMLPQLDVAGQQRLLGSHALIIGMGGLGSPVAMYLAAAGVGRLTLVDFDTVDLSNLQRQILHGSDDIGRPKVESAREALAALNPEVVVSTVNRKLEGPALLEAIAGADVVIDASDNFTTRFAINDACVEARKPLVSGAAIRMEGQVSVFHNEREESPCYRCLYRDEGELEQTCSENGVLAPVVGVIGALQATEALKVLAGIGETLGGRLLLWDAMTMEWRSLKLRKDPACPCCGVA